MRQHFPEESKQRPVPLYRVIINYSIQKYEKNYWFDRDYQNPPVKKITKDYETNKLFNFDFSV